MDHWGTPDTSIIAASIPTSPISATPLALRNSCSTPVLKTSPTLDAGFSPIGRAHRRTQSLDTTTTTGPMSRTYVVNK